MKALNAFFELMPCFAVSAVVVLQVFAWCISVDRIMKDEADYVDVLMLIPGFVFVGGIYAILASIPAAIRRKN